MRKLQIGVMGSAADLNYEKKLEEIAERVGELISENNCILLFGAEKDYDSLSTAACRGAKKKNGLILQLFQQFLLISSRNSNQLQIP